MATAAISPAPLLKKAVDQPKLAYLALLTFTFLYYTRPEDFIPGLSLIPMNKITGAIALIGLLVSLGGKDKVKVPMAVKVLMLLLVQMFFASLVAVSGAQAVDTTINKFSKGIIIALLIGMIVTTLKQMRTLLFIQGASVIAVAFFSILINHGKYDRLYGIQKGILFNPNDLAINIAISFPLCVAFLLVTKGIFRKILWSFGLITMLYGVYATYSRSGLIAIIISGIICFWAYGIKGKRRGILVATALLGVVGLGVVVSSATYRARVASLFAGGDIQDSGDHGSLEKRSYLLKLSLSLAAQHPVFGVGPGCYPIFSEGWQVAHNTYTEFAAEAGIPGLSLFLLALTGAFRNIKNLRKSPGYQKDPTIRLYTDALWASLAAYVAGAAFSSTEYNLFPYFVIAYTCSLYRMGYSSSYGELEPEVKKSKWTRLPAPKTEKLAWTR